MLKSELPNWPEGKNTRWMSAVLLCVWFVEMSGGHRWIESHPLRRRLLAVRGDGVDVDIVVGGVFNVFRLIGVLLVEVSVVVVWNLDTRGANAR